MFDRLLYNGMKKNNKEQFLCQKFFGMMIEYTYKERIINYYGEAFELSVNGPSGSYFENLNHVVCWQL